MQEVVTSLRLYVWHHVPGVAHCCKCEVLVVDAPTANLQGMSSKGILGLHTLPDTFNAANVRFW